MDTVETKFEAKHYESIGRMVVHFQTIESTVRIKWGQIRLFAGRSILTDLTRLPESMI